MKEHENCHEKNERIFTRDKKICKSFSFYLYWRIIKIKTYGDNPRPIEAFVDLKSFEIFPKKCLGKTKSLSKKTEMKSCVVKIEQPLEIQHTANGEFYGKNFKLKLTTEFTTNQQKLWQFEMKFYRELFRHFLNKIEECRKISDENLDFAAKSIDSI